MGLRSDGDDLHVPREVAEDAGRLAGLRVLLDLARPLGPEVLVDAAELQGQRVERGVGAGREEHGVLGRGPVQLRPGRVALLLEPGDEDLADDDPLPGAQCLGPRPDVVQHVPDRLHLGDRVVELGHARPGRVRVRVDQARQDHLAAEVDHRRARPAGLEDLLVGPDAEQAVALDGQGLADRELAVDRDDLAVVQDQVRLVGPRGRPAEAERQEHAGKPRRRETSTW